ncbi:hypothetical protein ACFQ0B_36065 [Nonomuraea thailandensis]
MLAGLSRVRLLSWDGERAAVSELPQGTSMVVNTGLDPDSERVVAYLPRFRDSERWGELITAEPSCDPGALIVRHELPDGRVFASLSVMEVAIAREGVTYDFTDLTADRDG